MTARASSTVFLARRWHALTPRKQRFHAVLVENGRIIACGDAREMPRIARRVDLGDVTVTPGLVDAHTHFFYWALNRALIIDLQGNEATRQAGNEASRQRGNHGAGDQWSEGSRALSLEATLQRIRAQGRKRRVPQRLKDGSTVEWVVARGFDQNAWPERGRNGRFPTAADLDRAAPDAPAIVRSRDGHSAWLNTAGLRAAGIAESTPDPAGGRFLRDERGRPTGTAQESAINLLPDPVRELALRTDSRTNAIVDQALAEAYTVAHSFGITGVHCMDDAAALAHFQRQHAQGKLGVRVVHSIPLENLDAACAIGLRSGIGDDWLRIGAVKIFADGALGSQTAWMFDEYPGRAGHYGVPVFQPGELRQIVAGAARRGWACWIHAIGDRAAHEAIAAIIAARRLEYGPQTPSSALRRQRTCNADEGVCGPSRLQHRIEHLQCVRPADLRRMAKAGIHASMQPCHMPGDIDNADRHWPRARRNTHAWRRVLDAGVNLACGSDVPIESIDPRLSLFAAANRTGWDGSPAGGWFPEQRISVEECLRGFTSGAARSVGEAAGAGTIAVGQRADFTIWQDDPLKAHGADLLGLRIANVVINGEIIE